MRAALRAMLLGVLLCACTKDFSRFKFRDLPPVPKLQDAGDAFASDANSGAAVSANRVDAGARAGDQARPIAGRGGASAGRPAGGAGGRAGAASALGGRPAADEDAGSPHDAAMPQDASQPVTPVDAGPTTEQQCQDGARELSEVMDGCTSCACDQCAPSVLTCLNQGESVYDRPCRELLKCALTSGCRDWDCYCKSTACRTNPDAEAEGPCITEMNVAAGGSQDHAAVIAAHAPDADSSPLKLAVSATTCIFGAPRGATTAAVEGRCKNACELP